MTEHVARPSNPFMLQASAWERLADEQRKVDAAAAALREAERALNAVMREVRPHLSLRNIEAITGISRGTLAQMLPAGPSDLAPGLDS